MWADDVVGTGRGMTVWTGWSTGARVAGVSVGAAVVAVAASIFWPAPQPTGDAPAALADLPQSTPEAQPSAATEPAVDAAAETPPQTGTPDAPEAEPPVGASEVAVAEPAAEPEAESDTGPMVPGFDNYRVEADGSAVVSGRAEPLAAVSVLVDGIAVAGSKAGGDGSFAALFTLDPNPQPSLMTLQAVLEDGRTVASVQSVALGPIAGPVVVADGGAAAGVVDETAEPEETNVAGAGEPEPGAPVALLVTDDGATMVQSAAAEPQAEPATVAAVVLDAISYSPAGAVQLSGKGQAEQAVRIYLDNAPVAEAAIAPSGLWQVTLGDTPPGIYTLRVDQVDASGAVSARVETPFKRETLEALAALAQPAAAALDEPAQAVEPAAATPLQPPAEPAVEEALPAPAPEVVVAAPALPVAAADQTAPELAVAAADPAATTSASALAPVETAVTEPTLPAASSVSITVQPGFTLWGIARDSLGDGVMYVQVYEANRDKIRNPDLIYPGQVFTIPGNP